jgi:HK97 family phage portal protein
VKIKLFGRTYGFKAASASSSTSVWNTFLAGRGFNVSADTALQISAVFRCVDLISKTLATLPMNLYKDTKKGQEKASEHPVYQLVHYLPNHQTTAYEFWQCYVANLLLSRGAFAKIIRSSSARIAELWNIPTRCVSDIQINSENGERYVDVTLDGGGTERLHEGDFMYTPGFLFSDRNKPEDPLRIASEVLGLSDTLGTYAKSAASATNPGGYVEVPTGLTPEAFTRLRDDFNKNYKGAQNAGAFMFLETGMKATQFDRDLEKMQLLESRKHAVTEICRIFGVPPHMAMDLGNATFSNIEHQSLEFVRDCMNPLCVRIEQTAYRDLLTEAERRVYYFKVNTNALLRGDTATRQAYYNTMRQTGVMSANDVCRLEDYPLIPAEQGGDDRHVNGNMILLANARQNIPKGATTATVSNKGAQQ